MSDPFTPPDCDLRDFAFMPIDIVRLLGSEFHARASDGAWRAGVTLWLRAWHQVPAGSLPDDDISLCRLAELGRDMRTWKKIKDDALRGWAKGSDGRLYHPTVSEKVAEAWDRKLRQRHRTFCATIRKHNERHKPDELTAPNFEDWIEKGRPEKIADFLCHASAPPAVTRDTPKMSRATTENVSSDIGSKGQGQGQGQYKPEPSPTVNESSPKPSLAREEPPSGITDPALALNYVCAEADWNAANDTQRQNAISIINGWLALGCSLETILQGIASARRRDPAPTKSLKRFDSTIRGMRRDQLGGELPVTTEDVRQVTGDLTKRWAVQ
jgi:hypothetical protein